MRKVILLTFVMLFTVCLNAHAAEKKPKGKLEPGDKAPKFALWGVDGEMRYLTDYCGAKKKKFGKQTERKTVILNFIATWCKPCKKELPTLQGFYDSHKDDDVEVLLIFCERTLKKEQAKTFLEKFNVTIPALLDPYSVAKDKYGVDILPATFVITKEGKIHSVHIAAENIDEVLEKKLEEVATP